MSDSILITGGTGTLGRDLVPLLPGASILSRTAGENRRVADLATGAGLDAALAGIDTVIHLADGKDQAAVTRTLVDAASRAGVRHLVFISIVGIDRIPFAYYTAKLAAERVVTEGPVPFTVLRTTQFHQFAAMLYEAQRFSPFIFSPKLSIQPIDTRVVAARLAELAAGAPAGRVADMGGPEVLTGDELTRLMKAARGWKRAAIRFSLPGKTWAAYAAGHHLAPDARSGGRTFAEFLAS